MVNLSQRDPYWADDHLGTGKYTLGQAGCLVTAMSAMLMEKSSDGLYPDNLNAWLTTHEGYEAGDLFRFASVAPLGLWLRSLIVCPDVPAPIAGLQQALAHEWGVVVEVDFNPGGEVQPHWVLLRTLEQNSGQVMDPWLLPGEEESNLDHYMVPGWDTSKAILCAAMYNKKESAMGGPTPKKTYVQPGLCIRK